MRLYYNALQQLTVIGHYSINVSQTDIGMLS